MIGPTPPRDLSGRISSVFLRSKLTPLVILVSLALGLFATWTTPWEEEPSITVTMADVFVAFPGRGATEVDERIARPVSSWIREIPTVDHVYSVANDDGAMFMVQFREGVDREKALVQLYERLNANAARLPPGVPAPLVKPRGIEDVPVLALTLWAEDDDALLLRRLAAELTTELQRLPDVSRVEITGGSRRSILVEVDARGLAERGLAIDRVVQAVQASNVRLPAGTLSGPDGVMRIEAGALLTSAEDVGFLIVGATAAGPVYLRDVANLREGATDPTEYVTHFGRDTGWAGHASVALSITKVPGSNASDLTKRLRAAADRFAAKFLPSDMHMVVTRDTGQTATDRVTTLLEHMAIATLVVVLLVGLALGWREALVVAVVVPVTLAIVPFVYKLTGFTLNRITLAAMIFSIGILVDDAIVIIENIHRHYQQGKGGDRWQSALKAVSEVGNPTILATFTVIIALVPTAFVTGMTGQYVRPLPIGASVAMFYSLFVALSITPYLASRLLRYGKQAGESPTPAPAKPHRALYRRGLGWVMATRWRALAAYSVAFMALAAVLLMVPTRLAVFKLLPLANTDELSVVIDLPRETTLEDAHAVTTNLARRLAAVGEIESCQVYVGSAGPLTFQGVARHYMLRREPGQAEIQIQLTPASTRKRTSHELASVVRGIIAEDLSGNGATFTVAELPPGPPVQATLLAEVYGPDDDGRLELAEQVKNTFHSTADVVDVDWSARPGPGVLRYDVDIQKAAVRGLMAAQVAMTVRTLFDGDATVWAQVQREREPVPVVVRLSRAQRSSAADVMSLSFSSMDGRAVPASDIGRLRKSTGSRPLFRKDLQPMILVTGETTGAGPAYTALDITDVLQEAPSPDGRGIDVLWTNRLPDSERYSVRWGGEWTTTYEVFRDLGVAFAVVLFLLYVLLVGWYQSFATPIVVMLPIPLAFVGIIPAHALLGFPLTGMAVIGAIALAGLMVRNSILVVDFARESIASGMDVKEAVLLAGQTRLRPILLTAATVILGDGVLFFDPLLQGLGLTMASGALVSTALTLGIVPLAYYHVASSRFGRASQRALASS